MSPFRPPGCSTKAASASRGGATWTAMRRQRGPGRSPLASEDWLYVAASVAIAVIGSAWLDLSRAHLATPEPPLATGIATVLAQVAPLAFARRWAAPALGVSLAATAALILEGFPGGPSGVAPLLMLLLLTARAQILLAGGALLGTWAVLALTSAARPHLVGPTVVVANVAATILFFLAGIGFRLARERRELAGAREAAAVAAQAATTRAESLAVRLHLARELHDSLGHALTVALVQARAALDRPDAARREIALRAIEQVCDGSLRDLQHLVESLRDETAARQPAPVLNHHSIAALARAVGSAGVQLDLDIDDGIEDVPPPLAACAWRVLQEAVTNSLRHGDASRIQIRLRRLADRLDILVLDNGSLLTDAPDVEATREGAGLRGMRERVTALGGHLHVGPRVDGGFEVVADIPLSAEGLP
jgi:signal transduction histidine kinase